MKILNIDDIALVSGGSTFNNGATCVATIGGVIASEGTLAVYASAVGAMGSCHDFAGDLAQMRADYMAAHEGENNISGEACATNDFTGDSDCGGSYKPYESISDKSID